LNIDIVLFVLRLVSGGILLLILFALFVILWRDYRSAAVEVEANRRIYGQLVVLQEVDGVYVKTGDSYPLLPLTSLGRSPTNSIRIDDNFASSEHALVAMRNGQWWLEDRQSRNGTMLNDMLINQPVVITHGDMIGIGNTKYRLELEH
jgi:hypothetical protein